MMLEGRFCFELKYIIWRSFGKDGRFYGILIRMNLVDELCRRIDVVINVFFF